MDGANISARSYLTMNRNGTTVLTGTVLLSMLLSPIMRAPEPQAAPPHVAATTQVAKKAAAGRADQCETAACREAVHKEIQQEAGDEYRRELHAIVTHVCRTQDYRSEEKAAKKNQTVAEMEEEERRQEKSAVNPGKCLTPGNFIIALVPDPAHTHLALLFDRTVDAIEEAVQDEGYNFERAAMPWDAKVHPESDDYESRLEAEWYQKGKEKYPGLIAFRRDNSDSLDQRALFVLIVGETPTAGVHVTQFENAVEFIKETTGVVDLGSGKDWRKNASQEPGLRIVGPMFSGSMPSLTKVLKCGGFAKPKPCYPLVSIHSGSVSSRDDILKFDRQAQTFNGHFVSLHESDEVMEERFLEFLTGTSYEAAKHFNPFNRLYGWMRGWRDYQGRDYSSLSDRHYAAKDIAVLSEDETAYGGDEAKEPDRATKDKPKESGQNEYCDSARKDPNCFLKLYFPREISQLRAAYQDSLVMSPATPDGRTPPRETLPSNFSVPGSDDDTVASYSAKQMPLSQESVLLDVVSELQRHSIKFIILRASDPMDTLFLSEFLRTAYPPGRIVTLEADLLFRHEASDPRLHGLLSLSTYSPAPAASHNFVDYESGHVERIFPSSGEAGTYNAARSIISGWVTDAALPSSCTQDDDHPGCACRHVLASHQQISGKPGADLRLYQYGWRWEQFKEGDENSPPNDDTRYDAPAVHLLALGRDDYWPVANFGPYPSEKLLTTLPRVHNQMSGKLRPVVVPNSWRVVQLVGILLGLGLSLSVWRASVFARTQAVAKYAPATANGRMKAIFVAGLTQMLILLILLWPSVHNAKSGEANLDYVLGITAVFVFLCIVVDLLNRTLLTPRSKQQGRWKGWGLVTVFVAASGLLAFQVFFNQPFESEAYLLRFSTLRAMQLTSGLSFIMPTFFFLTVWLWWADHSTAGYALLDDRRPRLPKGMKEPGLEGISEQVKALKHSLYPNRTSRIFYGALVILVFVGSWWMGDHSHPFMTLENNFLQGAMWVFFTAAVAGTIIITLRLWTIWIGVRKLLVALDSLPLRGGFKTIKGFSWNPIWRYGAGNLEDFQRIFNREKEALNCALNTYPLPVGDLHKDWDETWNLVATAREPQPSELSAVQHELETPTWFRRAVAFVQSYFKSWWERRRAERELIHQFGKYQKDVAEVTGKALDLLAQSWQQKKEEPKRSPREPVQESDEDLALRSWERCVCMVYVNFLLAMLVRIRSLIIAIGGMFVLTMVGVTQYPFEPKSYIQILLVVLLVYIVSVVGLVFAQIHRDATLSNITDTTPGELGADFWVRMISFTALPLFTLLASQFPSINRLFYSWLQPALQALNR